MAITRKRDTDTRGTVAENAELLSNGNGGETANLPVPMSQTAEQEIISRLEQVYSDLPAAVVAQCETLRFEIGHATLDRLEAIHDVLAPHGKWQHWCDAVGLDFKVLRAYFHRRRQTRRENDIVDQAYSAYPAIAKNYKSTKEERIFHRLRTIIVSDYFEALWAGGNLSVRWASTADAKDQIAERTALLAKLLMQMSEAAR